MSKQELYYRVNNKGNVNFSDRWDDLKEILDLNPNDTVLDVGCAEGLIAIEVAKKVKFVEAFDKELVRIKKAISIVFIVKLIKPSIISPCTELASGKRK